MFIEVNGKKVELTVTMWVVDENRFAKTLAEKPESKIWEIASAFWICYQNACRYNRVQPEFTAFDFELWADKMISSKEGKAEINKISAMLGAEISALNDGNDQPADGEKKTIQIAGEGSESLHLANVS